MKIRKLLAFAIALALAGTTGVTTLTANAAGLTQAEDASQVVYGVATAEELNILASLFDVEYYKANNPDVVEALGDDPAVLFEHFCRCGVFEGRTCNANFDPAAYASAYSDIKDLFGKDILKYYVHYVTVGAPEGRTITTLQACADANITVEALVDDSMKISPAVYMLAQKLGTNDFVTLQKAINTAAASSSGSSSSSAAVSTGTSANATKTTEEGAIVVNGDENIIIAPADSDAEAYAKAAGYEEAGTISVDDGEGNSVTLTLYVVKGTVGYAAYDEYVYDLASKVPVFETDDYEAAEYAEIVGTINVGFVGISETSSSSSSSDYDYTDAPYYSLEISGEYLSDAVGVSVIAYDSNDDAVETTTVAATYLYSSTGEVIGYYTNAEGTEVHYFETEEERAEWCAANASSYNEDNNYGYSFECAFDEEGTNDTEYSYGGEIVENEDGSVTVTVAVSNDEDDFGYITETTFTVEEE